MNSLISIQSMFEKKETWQEDMQLQCLELLANQVDLYTNGESSSIKAETAQSILQSILYTMEVYLKSLPDENAGLAELRDKSLNYIFNEGSKIINNKLAQCQILLEEAKLSRIHTDNKAYNDTLEHGLESFFKDYRQEFFADETPASIDYPLCSDNTNLKGVEYVYNYLETMIFENKFCSNFSDEDINSVMRGFHAGSSELLINIFSFVTTNLLGRILAEKDTSCLDISTADRNNIYKRLSIMPEKEIQHTLKAASEKICLDFNITGNSKIYFHKTAAELFPIIKNALETRRLEYVFISPEKNTPQPKIIYSGGNSMEDEEFRKVTEEIRCCRHVSDKIAIIKRKVGSIKDLVDILEAYCIFENEFVQIFDSLEDLELAMLINQLPEFDIDSDHHFTEAQKEWHNELNLYLINIDPKKKNAALQISKKIDTGII